MEFSNGVKAVPFYVQFPDEELEMQIIKVRQHPVIPKGTYVFCEQYCANPPCDCRRAYISVLSGETDEVVAHMTYGWERKIFYRKWIAGLMGLDFKKLDIGRLPACITHPDSELSRAFLRIFKSLLRDPAYKRQLKRHYGIARTFCENGAASRAE